jgi:hypothetical protein
MTANDIALKVLGRWRCVNMEIALLARVVVAKTG